MQVETPRVVAPKKEDLKAEALSQRVGKGASVKVNQSYEVGRDDDDIMDDINGEPAKSVSEDEELSDASGQPAPEAPKGEDEMDNDQQTPTAANYVHCSLASLFG